MEDGQQKDGYTISSYEPLTDLFFLYFNIWPNNNKTKINKKKNAARKVFRKALTCFILISILYFKGRNSEEYFLKESKKNSRILLISFDIRQASKFYII